MKKVRIVHSIWLLLLVLLAAQSAFADAPTELKRAQTLYDSGKYIQAETLYQQITRDYARTEVAREAQTGLAMLYAKTDRGTLLAQVCQNLMGDSAEGQDMAALLAQVADECRTLNKYGMAAPIYQHLVHHWPTHERAVYNTPQNLDQRLGWICCLNGKCIQETNDGEQA